MTRAGPREVVQIIPAPIGGLNARDPEEAMAPTDARILLNWWPETGKVRVRSGSAIYAVGLGGPVKTLCENVSKVGVRTLIAGADGELWNVSTSTPASLDNGFTSDEWSTYQFLSRTFLFNGEDAPQDWDGTALTATAWTGPSDITKLVQGVGFKNRHYILEADTNVLWYSDINAFTGALTSAGDFSALLSQGGQLLFAATLSQNTGNGYQTMLVLIGAEGDVLLYQGSYPADPDGDWRLVRQVVIPRPLGRRAYINFASDLLIATERGIISLARVMQGGIEGVSEVVNDKINPAIIADVEQYGGGYGWSFLHYSGAQMLLLNVRGSDVFSRQFATNTLSSAPTIFEGCNALSWSLFNKVPYFGDGSGRIFRFWIGQDDAGMPINTRLATSSNYFGDFQNAKNFNAIRPKFVADGSFSLKFGLDCDEVEKPATDDLNYTVNVLQWDFQWDASWGTENINSRELFTTTGDGYSCSLKMEGAISGVLPAFKSSQVFYEVGGVT